MKIMSTLRLVSNVTRSILLLKQVLAAVQFYLTFSVLLKIAL